jgi:hypothetical protein
VGAKLLGFLLGHWAQVLGALLLVTVIYKVQDYIGDQRETKIRAEYTAKEAKQREAYEKKLQKREEEFAEFQRQTEVAATKAAEQIQSANEYATRLEQIIARVKLTATAESKPNEKGLCPDTRLSDGYRLCWTAAITGRAEDAAACEAAGVHGAVSAPP